MQQTIKNQQKWCQNKTPGHAGGVLGGCWSALAHLGRLGTHFWCGEGSKSAPSLFKIARKIDVERVLGASWCVLEASWPHLGRILACLGAILRLLEEPKTARRSQKTTKNRWKIKQANFKKTLKKPMRKSIFAWLEGSPFEGFSL